jgi:uncharacterized repeat protein (TIGR03803 family)
MGGMFSCVGLPVIGEMSAKVPDRTLQRGNGMLAERAHNAIFCVAMLFAAGDANAAKIRVLYDFKGGQDGYGPSGGVIEVGGSLFGTTVRGGGGLYGTVFKFDRGTGSETILHGFQGGTDGDTPVGGLVYEGGKLYGVTQAGGGECESAGCGTVFAIDSATGAETVLHSFQGEPDGMFPINIAYAGGALYGTTLNGGTGPGIIFKVDVATGAETVLYDFGSSINAFPGNLIFVKGLLYFGDTGAIYSLDPATGRLKVVSSASTAIGDGPVQLVYDSGKLYGTSASGGLQGYGTVFEIDLPSGLETTLYSFDGGNDGFYPSSAVTYENGLLYGETDYDGIGQEGLVYSVNPVSGKEKVVCTFNGNKGANPGGGLLFKPGASKKAVFYGTAGGGGKNQDGTIFQINLDFKAKLCF